MDRISTRALGRTLLERQHLLGRTDRSPAAMVGQLVGLQAQEPRDPYLALWSRLEAFEPGDLEEALLDRSLVRMVAMRGTIHLLTAKDALGLRHLFQPVLDQEMARHAQHKAALDGLDLAPVSTFARELLSEPHPVPALRAALADRFPDLDPAALAFACRNTVPLVQAPPRGLWTRGGPVALVAAEHWLAGVDAPPATIDEVVVRYLRAFGPATAADIATWSRLTRVREVLDRLRPQLRTWSDDDGRELVDVPDAPMAEPDVPAPVRFLPEYDNVLLSHADRRRVIPDGAGALYRRERHGIGSVLVDGQVRASWWRSKGSNGDVTITVLHDALPKRGLATLETEAQAALPILSQGAADASVELRALSR